MSDSGIIFLMSVLDASHLIFITVVINISSSCSSCCPTVVSDTALELINIGSAAAVVHYDIPNVQRRFASRLLTMKSHFSYDCYQNRVSNVFSCSLKC